MCWPIFLLYDEMRYAKDFEPRSHGQASLPSSNDDDRWLEFVFELDLILPLFPVGPALALRILEFPSLVAAFVSSFGVPSLNGFQGGPD